VDYYDDEKGARGEEMQVEEEEERFDVSSVEMNEITKFLMDELKVKPSQTSSHNDVDSFYSETRCV